MAIIRSHVRPLRNPRLPRTPALAERLLDFERLSEAWPRSRTAVERAQIGRRHEEALCEIAGLRQRIATACAESLTDAESFSIGKAKQIIDERGDKLFQ